MDEVEIGMIIGEEMRGEEDREREGMKIENGRGKGVLEVTEEIEMIEGIEEIGIGIEGGRESTKREMNSESIFFACSCPHRERLSRCSWSETHRSENVFKLAPP